MVLCHLLLANSIFFFSWACCFSLPKITPSIEFSLLAEDIKKVVSL